MRATRQPSGSDDLEVEAPLPGKTHPRTDMGFVVPANDDERRDGMGHRSESGVTVFGADPDVADAAADLAAELSEHFLESAVEGQEMSAKVIGEPETRGSEPYLVDEEARTMHEEEIEDDRDILPEGAEPSRAARPARLRRTRSGLGSS